MALRFLLRFTLLSCLLLGIYTTAWATHNRAGEIVVEMVPNADGECAGSLTVKVAIVTYTRTSSVDADRDSLTLCYGDGSCEVIARTNGPGNPPQGEPQENDIKFNFYEAFHTYNGFGQYTISFEDMNRNAGIRNVNFPNSVSIPLYVENVFSLVNPAFSGCNNSPVLQVPPIDFACLGEIYTHNPGAFDPDGDSLVYELRVPEQGPDDPVPQFFYPNGLTIDRLTGDVVWNAPNEAAEFNIAINIISFRNGSPIDTMVRDMQIIVEDCENDPPELLVDVEEICVIAGEVVDFEVIATAPLTDISQRVQLVAYGAPLNLPADRSPATFLPNLTTYQEDPLSRQFRWQTTCDHISNQPYNIIFRAVDDFLGDTTGLATLKTVRIKVIGPPPEDVQASAVDNFIDVSWELPYVCEGAADEYFRGFTVWRRINSDQMPFDTCSPGLDGRGYTLLTPDGPILDVNTDGRYFFQDTEVERGRTYCYRILAVFARRTANGLFFYNSIESLPSNEACVQLGRDLPLLVKVDVTATDFNNGSIEVCWTKPSATDLDTIQNPGPYVYELQRATGQTEDPAQFQTITSFTSPTFAAANDTCFTDIGLNTVDNAYTYWVNFYVNNESEPLGEAIPAASLYLNASPTDRTNILSWDEFVPWENFTYTIFRENTSGGLDSIATVMDPIYRDEGLVNGQEYCYVIRSTGTYNIDGLPSPLLNRSQRVCAVPIDNVPPCPPVLTVTNLCDDDRNCDDVANLENSLSWEDPLITCPQFEDVAGYRIYYAPTVNAEFNLIATINDPNQLEFIHRPENGIAGCYAVTAIDTVSVANESERSNIVCVDNCPFYTLPNAFTPNDDGQNDRFVPIRSCFIASVEFQVFNRWGSLVFETTDPNLDWDGTNANGDELADGTYFYRCQVFENRVEGVLPAPELLSGYIELLRGAD